MHKRRHSKSAFKLLHEACSSAVPNLSDDGHEFVLPKSNPIAHKDPVGSADLTSGETRDLSDDVDIAMESVCSLQDTMSLVELGKRTNFNDEINLDFLIQTSYQIPSQ